MRISDWSSYLCSSDLGAAHQDDNGFALALELLKARVGNLLAGAGEMTGADDPYIFSTDIRHDPLAGDVTHVARLGPVEAAILRFRNDAVRNRRSEEHTSELQSLMRISYAVFCLKKKKKER